MLEKRTSSSPEQAVSRRPCPPFDDTVEGERGRRKPFWAGSPRFARVDLTNQAAQRHSKHDGGELAARELADRLGHRVVSGVLRDAQT